MDPKTDSIAFAVRLAAQKGMIRKPSASRRIFDRLRGRESYDKQLASQVVSLSSSAANVAKRVKITRKSKKSA